MHEMNCSEKEHSLICRTENLLCSVSSFLIRVMKAVAVHCRSFTDARLNLKSHTMLNSTWPFIYNSSSLVKVSLLDMALGGGGGVTHDLFCVTSFWFTSQKRQ